MHEGRGHVEQWLLKALRELESSGHFELPRAQHKTGTKSPRRLTNPVPLPIDVPDEVNHIAALELAQVQDTEQMRTRNWAATKAYYRMIEQPEDSAVNLKNILQPYLI